jgi:hypothetical protein
MAYVFRVEQLPSSRAPVGYLGLGDRIPLKDAIILRCESFLTMERRLPKNAMQMNGVGIRVLILVSYCSTSVLILSLKGKIQAPQELSLSYRFG